MARFLILLFLALFGWGGEAFAAGPVQTLAHDGIERTYYVHVPSSYQPDGEPMPLIIAMHGGGGDADSIIRASGMDKIADRYGFIAAYPEGVGGGPGNRFHTWNAGHCCGLAAEKDIDDVGFIARLIDVLAETYNIDRKRVYATGHSNGAQMSYRLACELSGKIAAIAPNASQSVVKECPQSRPVPILHFHGTLDRCAHYDGGGACGGCFADYFRGMGIPMKRNTWPCRPVPETLAARAKAYGCSDDTSIIYKENNVTCERWQDCPAGAEVTLCTLEGAGHIWAGPGDQDPKICHTRPDGILCKRWRDIIGPKNTAINASEFMWQLFRQYSLP